MRLKKVYIKGYLLLALCKADIKHKTRAGSLQLSLLCYLCSKKDPFLPPGVPRYKSSRPHSVRRWRRRWVCAPCRSAGHLWLGSSCPRCKYLGTAEPAVPWQEPTGLQGGETGVSEMSAQSTGLVLLLVLMIKARNRAGLRSVYFN